MLVYVALRGGQNNMPLFVCDKCGCIDNTALGFYWAKDVDGMWKDGELQGLALCSECAPKEYSDGGKTRFGKWHGKFTKKKWDGKMEVINR